MPTKQNLDPLWEAIGREATGRLPGGRNELPAPRRGQGQLEAHLPGDSGVWVLWAIAAQVGEDFWLI